MAENVKVAVRVRPFNAREKSRNATLIIDMQGNTTKIKNPEDLKAKPKEFNFDYSYWSHDGYNEGSDGYLSPADSRYADQRKVYDDLGKGVLDNAWKGYNCSLFAYGQTGSGKSYSMTGYGMNKGIVPISCEELFKGIEEKKPTLKKGEEYQVSVSMLEIYNEQVRDLLSSKKAPKGGLKVRQHPSKGFYVDGLITAPVKSYADIDAKYNEGARNRTVAATQMNATSSRAHTIVAINFTQKAENAAGENMTKTSLINLVDLAGSERADSTGASGDRLKEGSAINQSLSTLGNVIKALADQASGKKNVIVPFRNSVLTRLLKNALDGNSKTIMIAALSPADINYDETLSTLRFADRAKSIKTKAVINENPTDRLIRELREENDKLKKMLEKGGVVQMEGDDDAEESRKAMEEAMKRNAEEMEAMQRSWEQKLAEAQKEAEAAQAEQKKKEEQKKVIPHLWNLNADPSLSGMILHFCQPGVSKVGNKNAAVAPAIQLNGLNIQTDHATITNTDNKVTIKPTFQAKVIVNGQEISKETILHHNDRVLFGSTHLYVFHHPQDLAKQLKDGKKVEEPTYDTAQEEIAEKSGIMQFSRGRGKEDLLLQEDLVRMMPMVNEANAMSEELDKKVHFEIAIISPEARGKTDGRTEVWVKMKNMENGVEWMWDQNKFLNRKYIMQEMYSNYCDGDQDWNLPQDRDPFWEPTDAPVMIGCVQVLLQSVGYMIDMEERLSITDFRGHTQGHMNVKIDPCNSKFKPPNDDDFVDDPDELVGKELYFKLNVKNIQGLASKFNKAFCRYKFYLDDDWTVSKEVAGMNPQFEFERKFTIKPVTKQFVEYLMSDTGLIVEVWGRQKGEEKKSKSLAPTKELMQREKTTISASKKEDYKQDMMQKVSLWEKRFLRAEDKLRKIQNLVNTSVKAKKDTLSVKEVENILNNNSVRFKGVSDAVALAKKREQMGGQTSSACTLQ